MSTIKDAQSQYDRLAHTPLEEYHPNELLEVLFILHNEYHGYNVGTVEQWINQILIDRLELRMDQMEERNGEPS